MALLIPAVRQNDISRQWSDRFLAGLDFHIWGANPCVWLERLQWPALVEWEQLLYTLFLPAVILVALLLWRKGRFVEFQYYAFLIAVGYMVSYVGYIILPARGPRYLLNSLQHIPLQGLWLFRSMQDDAGPPGIGTLRLFSQRPHRTDHAGVVAQPSISKRLFRVYFAYTLCIIFATVYLRYHYTVDFLAGARAGILLLICGATVLYQNLSEKGA